MAARSDLTEDLFCKCCINYFKRDNPSIILEGGDNYLCYTSTGMCCKCFEEMNPHKFGDKFEELLGEKIDGANKQHNTENS